MAAAGRERAYSRPFAGVPPLPGWNHPIDMKDAATLMAQAEAKACPFVEVHRARWENWPEESEAH